MHCKLSFITMVCWMFASKGAFVHSDQNHRRLSSYPSDETKQMQNDDISFDNTMASLDSNLASIEQM